MKSVHIDATRCSDEILKINIRFEEELTAEFAQLLYRAMRQYIEPHYKALIVDIEDVMLLEISASVLRDSVEHFALKQFEYGVALTCQSRISRSLLSGVLMRSHPVVPVRIFSDGESALDWLKVRAEQFQ